MVHAVSAGLFSTRSLMTNAQKALKSVLTERYGVLRAWWRIRAAQSSTSPTS